MSTINGTPGDDVLTGTPGNDIFAGSAGFDTAQLAAASGDAVFSLDAQGRWVVSSPQGVDALDNMEAVQFADATVTLGLAEFRVNASTALDQTQPVLTSSADGGFLATWLTGGEVRAQRFDENGLPSGGEIISPALGPVPPVSQHHDTVALADGGSLIAAVTGDMTTYTDRYGTHTAIVPVVVVMRFGSDGGWLGAWSVAAGARWGSGASDVSQPGITALSDGSFLVTWTASFANSQGGSGSSFAGMRVDSSGTTLHPTVTLPAKSWGTDVAALPDGGYALAWSGDAAVQVQHFDGAGTPVGPAVQVGTGYAGSFPQLTTLADGNAVVAWTVPSGSGYDVIAQRLDGASIPLGDAVRVNTAPVLGTAQPGVTALGDGGYVVAWSTQEPDGSGTDVHAQRFDANGATAGAETMVNIADAGFQQQPTVTALADGGFAIGWMSLGPGTDGWDIHARRFGDGGVPMPSGHGLQGGAADDTLRFAGNEPVQLLGGDGDDVLQGGTGDDTLDGGPGTDTAVSADLHAALTWQLTADHQLRVTGPRSGSDVLRSVEQLQAEGAGIGVRHDGGSEERLVADYESPYALLTAPAAAVLADGGSVVAWERHGRDAGIYVQRFDPAGAASGPVLRIDGWKAAVAALEDGGYVLAWTVSPSGSTAGADIELQRFDAAGTALGPPARANETGVGDPTHLPAIAALPGGGFGVSWVKSASPADSVILIRQFDGSGIPLTTETPVNTVAGPYSGEQSIGVLPDGSYVITWTMGDPQTWPGEPGYDIYARRFDAGGEPAGSQVRVNATTSGHQLLSDVAALADGGYVVTWMNYIYSDRGIKAQRFDATGAPVGDEVLVNPATPHSDASGPVVAALADGGYVIGWTSSDDDRNGITVQRFDASGTRMGTESRVNASAAGDQSQPALTALDDGGYMVMWLSHDDESYGIDTQRFDANNLREGHLTLTGGAEDNVLRVTTAPEGVELIGGGGRDVLAAAAGWDVLSGGSGGDTFEFAAAGNGVDTVTDWGMADRISVAGASFSGAVTAGAGESVALNAVQASTADGITRLFIGTDATPGADVVIRLAGSFAADSFTLNGNFIEAPKGFVVTGRGELVGSTGDDTLIALHGVTRMEGGDGDDIYVLGNPNDRLVEQPGGGNDEVRSEWNYTLGDNLERLLLVGDRHTRATGNELENVITGNGGRNVLTGDAGADTLTGGSGADQFVYRSVEESGVAPGTWDVVLDFSSLEGDRIDLRDIDANPARPGRQGFVFIGSAEFSSTDATGQLRFDAGTHMLYASVDADAQAEMAIELAGVAALAAGALSL